MISEKEKIIIINKDDLIAIVTASIRAGCTCTLMTKKKMDRDVAKNLAEIFIDNAIELEKWEG